ncbi:MAG: M50 family metallopeptidase [Dehalococcoidales bacterium]|nr:M50 family metallopeptidase [Dehalococcoidales bacterium]MDP7415532.1 M50 family metallopeptidase [Dehalococcoidales bacterium]
MFVSIVAFLGVIIGLIIAHELGHFVTAKISRVAVDEVGLGFPPRLLSVKRGETRYSLNAIPLGGFVKMVGEEDPKVPGSLAGKSAGSRLLVLGSGSMMNFLLPLLLLSVAFMVPRDVTVGQVLVAEVAPVSPAFQARIEPGDRLLEINGDLIRHVGDLQRDVQLNLGREVTLLVKHEDDTIEEVRVIPRWRPPEGQGRIGVIVRTISPTTVREYYPFWQAIPMGVAECIEVFTLFKNGIISMIIGTERAIVAGPVAIAQLTGEVAKAGFSPLLEFAAFLSINLAIINLLPLPALDGGRIVFLFLERVRRGKRVPPKIEGLIHMIGFAMLIAFLLAITYQDIIRIINGESLIP